MTRLLVVDDEKSIVFALRSYFAQRGYTVDCARSSQEARHLLSEQTYEAAIVDVHLEGIGDGGDGLTLAAHIRIHAPATGVVMLSASATAENHERAVAIGVHTFLKKPAPLSDVADAVRLSARFGV